MKIIPTSDILIEGKHSPAGEATTTSKEIALSLIAQGFAKPAPAEAKEGEAAAPETAARKPAGGGKAPAAKPATSSPTPSTPAAS